MFTQTQSANSNKPIENIQGQAVAKHQANKLEDALNLYLHSIEIDQNQPEWIYANAIALATQIDRYDTGFKLKREAENIYPQSDAIARAIALLFDRQNERTNAIKYYQKSLEFNSEQPEWLYVKLFKLLMESGILVEATKIKNIGLKKFPDSTAFQQKCIADIIIPNKTNTSSNGSQLVKSIPEEAQIETPTLEQSTQNTARTTPKNIEHIVDLDVSSQRRQLMDSAIVNQYEILLEQVLCHVTEGKKEMDTDALVHCLAEIKTDLHYLKTRLLDPPASMVDPQAKSLVDIKTIVNSAPPRPIKCELKERIIGSGWHAKEQHGRWTGPGTLSSIVLAYPTPGKYRLEIIVKAEAKKGLLQTLNINVGDRPLEIDPIRTTGNGSFPAVVTGEIVIVPQHQKPFLAIDLTIAETVNPPASDARLLGLLVERITLIPTL